MNYIGLVALILGLISIFITVKYVDNYDKLSYQIRKSSCNKSFKYPQELLDIQDELNLSDADFKSIIVTKRKAIIDILKNTDKKDKIDNKERFVDFNIYLSSYQRRIPNTELLDLFKKAKDEIENKSNYEDEIGNKFNYEDEKKLSNKAIKKQDKINSGSINKYFSYSNLNTNKTNEQDVSKPICLTQYGGNTYSRYVNESHECDGIISRNIICNS